MGIVYSVRIDKEPESEARCYEVNNPQDWKEAAFKFVSDRRITVLVAVHVKRWGGDHWEDGIHLNLGPSPAYAAARAHPRDCPKSGTYSR
jgi:hypothetical protein